MRKLITLVMVVCVATFIFGCSQQQASKAPAPEKAASAPADEGKTAEDAPQAPAENAPTAERTE